MTLQVLKITITPQMLANATKRADKLGSLHGSIEEGKANLQGMLGEEIVMSVFGYSNNEDRPFEDIIAYDLIIKNMKIDVKSKQTANGVNINMETSIYNPSQKCDGYIFCRISKDKTFGWILGWMPKREYFEKAKMIPAGTVDPTNQFTHKRNCYNLKIIELRSIFELR